MCFRQRTDALIGMQNLDIVQKEKREALCIRLRSEGKSRDHSTFFTGWCQSFEVLPLSLEEIFISETEVAGYDIRKLIMG